MDLTNKEYRLLKRISKRPLRSGRINPKDMAALSRLIELGYVERSFSQQGNNQLNDTGEMLNKKTEDESYRRYKHIQYRNLVLKSLLTFFLVLLFSYILKFL